MYNNPKVSLIILNWNGKEDTAECLESLKHITYSNYEIILIDNGSTDGSVKYFQEYFPDIEIIENRENLGFAEGNNVGIRRAIGKSADYVLILNNDVIVDPEFLNKMIEVAENNKLAGAIGSKIYHYYDPEIIDRPNKKINLWTGNFRIFTSIKDNGNDDKAEEVGCITGCCMLIKTQLIKEIGGFDPEYFLYWEETDLCIRITKYGYKIIYVPKAKIWHKIESSGGSRTSYYYYGRNIFRFMKKNANKCQKTFFLFFYLTFSFWINCSVIIFKHRNIPAFVSYLKGTVDGFKQL
ncbi:MAG: glycosyltransferase family 2 protein [Bacteroidota bacterium]|nr:glycosyltransferase family 2 protein [Bacteroidota bacterium]